MRTHVPQVPQDMAFVQGFQEGQKAAILSPAIPEEFLTITRQRSRYDVFRAGWIHGYEETLYMLQLVAQGLACWLPEGIAHAPPAWLQEQTPSFVYWETLTEGRL